VSHLERKEREKRGGGRLREYDLVARLATGRNPHSGAKIGLKGEKRGKERSNANLPIPGARRGGGGEVPRSQGILDDAKDRPGLNVPRRKETR